MAQLLNQPLKLPCGVEIKNRLIKAAMTEGLADRRNRATDRHCRLYEAWAHGGAGVLLTGNVQVDRRFLERPGNVVVDGDQDEEQRAALRKWAETTKAAGADLWMQISHAGRQSPKIVATEPVAPSAIPLELPGGTFGAPRALSGGEVEDVIARFIHTAAIAQQTGFGGVQIHGAHGYLVSEFLSPRVNQRTDEWGGSLENRARLLLRIVGGMRSAVGAGLPISVKLNSSDFQKGGFAPEESIQVAKWLEEAGVDLLEVSGGSYEQPAMADIEGSEARYEETKRESTRAREAYFMTYAEEIRRDVKMPLMVTGGFRSRKGMEEALSSGACDIIGIGRPLCVDPDVPNKLMTGQIEAAISYEKRLRLGPGFLGPNSAINIVKLINGFGTMAFFFRNIYRLADGEPTKEKSSVLWDFVQYQRGDAAMAKALEGR